LRGALSLSKNKTINWTLLVKLAKWILLGVAIGGTVLTDQLSAIYQLNVGFLF